MAELLFQSKQEKLADGSLIIITKILGAIDGTTVRQFEDKLIGFFNQGVKNLILIFSDVKYINSTGMGLLVKLADKFQEGGGDIKLVGVPEKVIALFDMLGLLSLFKIYDTEEDAIESIGTGGGGGGSQAAQKNAPPPPPPPPASKGVPPPPPPVPAPVPPPHAAHPPAAAPRQQAPPPPPAPVASAPPPSQGGGLTIEPDEGGFDLSITEDPAASAPATLVSFPYDTQCGHCSGPIQFASKGNYRCARCGSFIIIDEYGRQSIQCAVNSKMVEFRCPSNPSYIDPAKMMLGALASQYGFSNVFSDEMGSAIADAIGIVIEKKATDAESFQILAVIDPNEMIVGIKSLNAFLVQGGPRDRRLPGMARKVDRLEVFPLPNKGQLLRMTKKKK